MSRIPSDPKAVTLILVVALATMTLAFTRSQAASTADAPQTEMSSRWEYQSITAKSPEELAAQANQGGSDSWEMVSAVHVLNTNRYQWVGFFKRPKK